MWEQPKVEAYQASPTNPAAPGMRPPPAGTVPHRPPVDPAIASGVGADGRPVPVSPVAPTPELLLRGRAKFDVHCAVCHGLVGDGQSQVALNMSLRKPPSLHEYRGVTDGHIYRVITEGFGLMGSYATELSVEDRWAVVHYVRALQLSQDARLDELPPEERGRLEKEGR
jgi:mono/diheme cytochrome c family protein